MIDRAGGPIESSSRETGDPAGVRATYVEDLDQFIPQAVYFVSPDGSIAKANRALEDLTGYKIAELVGKPAATLYAGNEDALKLEKETLTTGKVKTRNMTVFTKDNREVPVTVSTSLGRNDEGEVVGYFAVLAEASQNRQIQQKIEQAAREWRATLDAINDMVWISDADCHLLRVNRAYANILAMEPRQAIGLKCQDVFSWAKDACERCPHKQTMATKKPAVQEFSRPQDGACLEISTSPILNETSEVVATVCIARDVTNRKQAEQQIQSLNRLRQYFSPKLAQRLISDEDLNKVRRKNLTVFFADIRGFTALSDSIEPEELLGTLNEFFTEMTQVIFSWGGTVGKFIGDAIMGFIGDPEEDPNHAQLAVKMALDMQSRVKALNEKNLLLNDFPLAIGIGINTGFVTVGNIGPENYRDYTVIGRHVNLAARLEEEAKPGQVLISRRTYMLVANIVKAEEIGQVTVKGFDKPVPAYNVLGLVQ